MPKKPPLRKDTIQLPCGQAKPGKEIAFMAKNMGDFSRKFNERTKGKIPGQVVNVKIKVFSDGTYQFIVKTSPTIQFIKAKVDSQNVLSSQALKEIAEIKLPDLNTEDLIKAQKIIAGTARSAGIKVEG